MEPPALHPPERRASLFLPVTGFVLIGAVSQLLAVAAAEVVGVSASPFARHGSPLRGSSLRLSTRDSPDVSPDTGGGHASLQAQS